MTLNPRDRRALILGGAGVALLGVYFLVLEPLASAYDRLVSEHDGLAAKVGRAIRDARKAEYFAGQITAFEQAAGELMPPKPYDEQVTAVGAQIVAAAQMNGVQLRGSTPAAAVPWADDPTIELALIQIDAEVMWQPPMPPRPGQEGMEFEGGGGGPTAEAAWENVFKFIGSLYRIPGVLSVERLELSGDQKRGGGEPGAGAKISVRLTVSVLAAAKGNIGVAAVSPARAGQGP